MQAKWTLYEYQMKCALCTLQVEFDENNKDRREIYIYICILMERISCEKKKKKIKILTKSMDWNNDGKCVK